MTRPHWPLTAEEIAPGEPKAQTCPRCGLVYRRLRFERVTGDQCPMCALTDQQRAERERERVGVA